jgi:hypothetical protein
MGEATVLRLAERLGQGEIDFTDAMGEAAGAISVCWDESGVFLADRANGILEDLQDALAIAVETAVNNSGLAAMTGYLGWEITELLLQQPIMGFDGEPETIEGEI